MLEDVLMVYAALIGLATGGLVGWVVYTYFKKKRKDRLNNFDDEDQRFIDRRY